MKIKSIIIMSSLALLLSACSTISEEEIKKTEQDNIVEETPKQEVKSNTSPENSNKPILEEPTPEEITKVYLEDGVNYRGYGEFLDIVLETYNAEEKVYGVYYIGEVEMPNDELEYTITEDYGSDTEKQTHQGTVKFNDNYGKIVVKCDGSCPKVPNETSIKFVDAPANSERFDVETVKLQKYTE